MKAVVRRVKCPEMTVHSVASCFLLLWVRELILLVVWGECTHVFHMHCLLKWLGTTASKQQCPMDRRTWGKRSIFLRYPVLTRSLQSRRREKWVQPQHRHDETARLNPLYTPAVSVAMLSTLYFFTHFIPSSRSVRLLLPPCSISTDIKVLIQCILSYSQPVNHHQDRSPPTV